MKGRGLLWSDPNVIAMIRQTKMFLLLLFSALCLNAGAEEIAINYHSSEPDVNIKRGYILRDAVNKKNERTIAKIRESAELGMKMIALPKDLNQFDTQYRNSGVKNYCRAYRSKGGEYFGGDGQREEFQADGGIHINTEYLEICKTARDAGLQLVIQMTGLPSEGRDDGSVRHLVPTDSKRRFHESARFYALPAPGAYEENAQLQFAYMTALQKELDVDDIIWCGNQEPSHTAGYPGGKKTREGTADNIRDYVKVWNPVARLLAGNNMRCGGIQLNQASHEYRHAAETLAELNVPLDFFTIQNYKAEKNTRIIRDAIRSLDKYKTLKGRKILFNRYDYSDSKHARGRTGRFATSAGMIEYLKAERVIFDNADRIYGYNLFAGSQGFEMMNRVVAWLNSLPPSRKGMEGVPHGCGGFAFADEEHLYIAIWNEADAKTVIDTVILKGFPATIKGKVSAMMGSGRTLKDISETIRWAPRKKTIEGIALEPREFILLKTQGS